MRKVLFITLLLPIFMWGQSTVTICNGDSVLLYNNWETQNGIYTNGVTTTTLIVNPTPTITGSFILNGNAVQTIPNTFRLTEAINSQSGSAWNSVTLNLTQPFNFDVDMFFGYNNGGADGIAFLLQPISTSIGTGGGGMGYQGVSPSFAVEFDTWQNSSDPSYDHIAIQKNGDLNHNGGNNLAGPLGFPTGNINIEDGQWHNVVFSWDPSSFNFKVIFDGALLINYTNNIMANIFSNNPNVYWGFTAATGGANNVQQFRVNALGVQLSDVTICSYDTIQVNPQINTAAYTYLWSPNYNISNNTISSPYFSPDTTTTYTLEITNSYGCTYIDSLTINVDTSASSIIFPFVSQFCLGISPINLDSATPIGGNYLVNNISSTIFNPTINDVGVNTITYSYTSSNGCSNSLTNNITVYDSPSVLCVPTNVSCNGFTDGSAILTISGGTPNYTTNWGGYNPTSLAAGTYGYIVTDVNSCVFTDSIIIYEPEIFSASINTTNVNCNGDNNGTASVQLQGSSTPAGTVSTLSYCSSTPGSNTASTIDHVQLTGDVYNIDNNTTGSCDQYEDYTTTMYADITEGQTYSINVTLGDCSNNYASGGKVYIDWNIDGDFNDPGEEVGIIPYGVASTASIPITVPYSGAYGATRMRIVSQFLNNIPMSSIGPCDVGVFANPIYIQPWFGATEDYSIVISAANITATYIWSNGLTTDSVSGLSAGNYTVDITNGNGCTITDSVIISEPPALSIITSQNNISCFGGSNGDVTIDISGGIPDYTVNAAGYSQTLVGGISSFTTPSLLPAGTYPYTITDSNNCVYTNTITLTSPSQISTTEIINNVSCNGGNDGNVSLIISGGTPTYSENWGTNNSASLSAGSFNYTVTDNNGCIFTDSVNITEPQIISISSTFTNVSTCGADDGSIDINTIGGTTPYTFSWTNGLSTEDISNLAAGTYTLTVTDNNSCSEFISVTITEPIAPIISFTQLNTTCFGGNDGSIDISVTGGISPYIYSWSTTETTEDISNLSAGNYSVSVSDINNCVVIENITITEPTEISTTSTLTNVTNCNGTDGSIDITPSGGNSPYTFLWSNNLTSEDINGLSSGNYSVVITDNYNCTNLFNFTLSEPSGIMATETINNVNCFGENSGSVIIQVFGGVAPYSENWNGYNASSLSAGTYTYIVTDNLNCNFSNTITITEPQELLATENIINVLCKDENTGNVTLNITGGTPNYSENWGVFNPNALYDGNYTYTVTDINGCVFTNQVTITEPDSLLSTISTTDAKCFGANDGTAILNINGGTASYYEDWFGQNNMALSDGNYSVLITDNNSCTLGLNFTINQPTDINIIIDSVRVSCFGYSDGKATLQISGGTSPYTEDWSGQNPLVLSAGTHPFSVTDSNNCVKQGIATIYQPNAITTNPILSDVKCFGGNNGTAFLQIYGGTSPYTEDWNGVNILQLIKGNYTYTITDNNGCTFMEYVTINEPDIISVTETIVDANCFNSNDGQAILNISGGTTPYIEDWGIENPNTLSAGVYFYTVSDFNSCIYSDSVLINQSNEILMSFSLESPICIYDTSEATIFIPNPTSASYTIEINDGTITTNYLVDSLGLLIPLGNQISFNPESNRIITIVSISDEDGCNSSVNIFDSLIVNPLPVLTLDIPNYCENDSSFILNQGTPIGGTYFVDGVQTSLFDIEKLRMETYNIRYDFIDPITSCFNSISTDVQINNNPFANFRFGPQPANIDNPTISFINNTDNYNMEIWSMGDGDTIYNQSSFSHTFSDTGTYVTYLFVQNTQGCTDTISYKVVIDPVFSFYVPSAFTPNKDGDNDSFGPVLREGGFNSYTVNIFNQWGEIIFSKDNMFWDGKQNDEYVENGTYTYTIVAYDFLDKVHSKTGSLILIR